MNDKKYYVEVVLTVPEGVHPELVKNLIRATVNKLDQQHKILGGNGLKLRTIKYEKLS